MQTLSGESGHRVIFSRANTSENILSRNTTYDTGIGSYRNSEVNGYGGLYDAFDENVSLNNTVDDSRQVSHDNRDKLHWFYNENRWNFFCFCVGVSLSTAPVISTLFWAPVVLDHHYAGIGNGCFFLVYAMTSICIAKSLISYLGCTRTFLYCHMGNILYCTCFLIEFTVLLEEFNIDLSTSGSVYPLVASVGGFSQSLMWTAHVKYFYRCAHLMLESMKAFEIENLNRSLASSFALIYFISLCLVFLCCVLVIYKDFTAHQLAAFFLPGLVIIVLISTFCLYRLDDMGDKGDTWENFRIKRGLLELSAGVRSMSKNMQRKLLCLVPYQVAWGCTSAFWVYYVLGEVVNDEQGWGYVGIICMIDFSASLIFSYFGNKMTKYLSSSQTPMIVWGWLCMTAMGAIVLAMTNSELGGSRYRIIGYAILHGMARAVNENNQKAVIANFFPEHETVAYAVATFSRTFTAGITYLYYTYIVTRSYYGGAVLVTSSMGIVCYFVANALNDDEIMESYSSMRSSSTATLISENSESVIYVAEYF